MRQCPKCGRYMLSYMEKIFDGARIVWTCSCGYSTKESNSGLSVSDKTDYLNTTHTENSIDFTIEY